MAYIYNNKVEYSDSPNLDAFGRLRIAELTGILEVKHAYNKLPLLISEYTAGTATSVFQPSGACVRMSTSANNDLVIRQTKIWAPYQAGKSQLFEGSFNNFAIQTNVIKRVGIFHTTTASTFNTEIDGIFLESNGVTNQISFQIWNSGTTSYSSTTASWNSTEINPSSIDWTKTQLMFIDYQWLGVGRVRLGIIVDGITYIVDEFTGAGNLTSVYMSSSNQPIRYEIRQVGAGSGYFDMICAHIASEGSRNDLFAQVPIISTATTTFVTAGVKYPYIGIRLNPQYRSIYLTPNNSTILNTSNDNYLATLEFNPTLSSTPTWTDSPTSPVQYSIQNGTPTITSTYYTLTAYLGEAGTSATSNIQLVDDVVNIGSSVDGIMDEFWICITPLTSNATFSGIMGLKYFQ